MGLSVKNFFYFPNPGKGGIEKNLRLWSNVSESFFPGRNILISNQIDGGGDGIQTVKPHLKILIELLGARNKEHAANIIVFRGVFRPLMWVLCLKLIGFRHLKLIYRANNDPFHWWHEKSILRLFSEIVKSLLLPFYDMVVFNSHELSKRCNHYNRCSIVIPNPVELRTNINFRNTNKRILFVGRKAKQKNIENLIAAFGHLDANVRLTIIGFENDGFEEVPNIEYQKWSAEICFTDFSYILMPSLYEGSPNALLEGLNHGLIPIFTPFKSGAIELVKKYRCPYFVATGFSSKEIADIIMDAVNEDVNHTTATPNHLSMEQFEQNLKKLLSNA